MAWWCGDDAKALREAGNLGERQFRRYFKSRPAEDWDDEYMMHAPVGSFAANPFGLHDVIGNVSEWCADGFARYDLRPAPGTGERPAPGTTSRVVRGGSFEDLAPPSRSGARASAPPSEGSPFRGFRPARMPATN
jgi:formylglycine-generating enzyme required for sulfatase activity